MEMEITWRVISGEGGGELGKKLWARRNIIVRHKIGGG